MAFYLSKDKQVLYEGNQSYGEDIYDIISDEEAMAWFEQANKPVEPEPVPPAPLAYSNETLTAALLALTQDL